MTTRNDYAVARAGNGRFRLDQIAPPAPGVIAYISSLLDRNGGHIGWRLKSLVMLQGARRIVWDSVSAAIVSTNLARLGLAKAATGAVDSPTNSNAGAAP
jgi:hypothetical protein